jgi:hypothetical protein
VYVYLAAYPGFSCTLKMDSDSQGNYAYFDLKCNSDLTFDGNLTIDGQYPTVGNRTYPLICLESAQPVGTNNNSFTMAGNGVALENNYNLKDSTIGTGRGGAAVGLSHYEYNIFTMEGGRITGNISPAGAVYLIMNPAHDPKFIMKGGSISGNYTDINKTTPLQIYVRTSVPNDPNQAGVYWGPGVYGRVDGVLRATPANNPDPAVSPNLNGLPFSDTDYGWYNVNYPGSGGDCYVQSIQAFK